MVNSIMVMIMHNHNHALVAASIWIVLLPAWSSLRLRHSGAYMGPEYPVPVSTAGFLRHITYHIPFHIQISRLYIVYIFNYNSSIIEPRGRGKKKKCNLIGRRECSHPYSIKPARIPSFTFDLSALGRTGGDQALEPTEEFSALGNGVGVMMSRGMEGYVGILNGVSGT